MSEKESKDLGDVNRTSTFGLGEMTMKLFFLFAIMDLLTILAYPIIFVYGKTYRFSKSKVGPAPTHLYVGAPVEEGR